MVFDEAHVYLHDDYRASTHAVSKATVLPHLRYIFLSGTVAPFLEQTLADRLNLGSLTVVRALTVRPNIKYQVTADDAVVMGQDGLEDRLIELGVDAVNKHQLESGQGGGVLVICRTREMAYKLGGALSCGVYVSESEGTPEAEAAMDAMEQFLKKTTSILVGTSAAGTGIHRDDLRAVIHVGLPWQKVDFAQQSGRAGRDGLRAISSILTHTTEIRQQQEGHIEQDSFSILDFVTTTGCRRATLSAVLDGDAIGCLAVEDGVLCDNCDRDMEEALEGVGMAIEMKEEEEEGYMMESGGVPWSDSPGVPSSIPAASSSSTRSSMAPPPVPLPRHSTPTSQPVPKRRRMNPLTSATRAIALTPEPSSSQLSVRSPSMISSPVSRLASDESQVLQEGPFAAPSVSQYMPTPPRASQPRRSGSASMSSAPPQRSGVGALRSGSHSMRLVSSATASSSRLPAPAPSSVPGAFTSASNILARNQAGVDRQATEGQVAGLVEELKGQCAVCFVQDCDFNHAPGRCPNFPYASGNVSQIGRWSSRLKFDSNYSACFGCAMPLETCKIARGGATCTGSTHPTAVREITLALVDDPTLFQRAMGEVRRNRPGFALTPPTPGGSVPTDWRKKVGEFNNRYWQGWVLVETLLVGAKGRRRL
ncbi:hypothetical protein CF319_g8261 [Tilletia indica]|nr:hypothetical protein CF319_g8261 [Tilletia indica]